METPDVPDSCLNDDHNFDQTGRCRDCGHDRAETADSWENRRSGGAGVRTQPLTNGEHRRRMEKL